MNTGASLSGDIETMSFMLNIYYEYRRPDWPVAPYAGAGLGVVRVFPDNVGPVAGSSLDDSDLGIAAQGIVGLAYDLGERISTTVEYRHLRAPDLTFETRTGGRVDSDYAANQFMLGMRYRFGGAGTARPPARAAGALPPQTPAPSEAPPAAPPNVAAAPPAPASAAKALPVAPPAVRLEALSVAARPVPVQAAALPQPSRPDRRSSVSDGRALLVYFAVNSSYLDANGIRIVHAFAEGARRQPDALIYITGFADSAGPSSYNKWLSLRRARRVRDMLVRGAGEAPPDNPPVNDRNRRVEVRFAAPRNGGRCGAHGSGMLRRPSRHCEISGCELF